ncbi:hypothetical protein [Hydrocarboniphaga sp.]|uniref:hypothetical protein n=1 Tax=Hydrocarboniphaga sp. TaxID=2033016 RepID=UPI003D0ADA62
MNYRIIALSSMLALAALGACTSSGPHKAVPPPQLSMDKIAEGYVRQVLAMGEHDPNYVDAYYGPKAWQDDEKKQKRSLLAILNFNARLQKDIETAPADPNVPPELWALRKRFLRNQLGALEAKARMLDNWKPSFDDESLALYDVSAPFYGREDFSPMLAALDKLLPPGEGTVSQRYNRYLERYAIPADKVEAVMTFAINAARARTLKYFRLPEGERFELSLVNGKPWSAYNWYQGNYLSKIEVNVDQPISVSRAIGLASHEGYPGHHVYNVLLEDQLVKGRGWKEFTVYPLYSPQSFIAEGTADFGVTMAFPPAERLALERQLFELAGFDPAEVETYDAINEAAKPSGNAVLEAARRYRDGSSSLEETVDWLQTYGLTTPERAQQRLKFFDTYGAYIINYSYGEKVIHDYMQRTAGADEPTWAQWRAFFDLLSTPRTPSPLLPD